MLDWLKNLGLHQENFETAEGGASSTPCNLKEALSVPLEDLEMPAISISRTESVASSVLTVSAFDTPLETQLETDYFASGQGVQVQEISPAEFLQYMQWDATHS